MNISIDLLEDKNDISTLVDIEKKIFSNPWVRSQFDEYLNAKDKSIFVARIGSEVIGYIIIEHVLDEGHIANLAVRSEFRGKGMGRKLVNFVIIKAKSLKLKWLELEVRESNEKAKKFYSYFGFKEVRRRKEYYIKPVEDALVLRMEF